MKIIEVTKFRNFLPTYLIEFKPILLIIRPICSFINTYSVGKIKENSRIKSKRFRRTRGLTKKYDQYSDGSCSKYESKKKRIASFSK